jgi:hypothetical protein
LTGTSPRAVLTREVLFSIAEKKPDAVALQETKLPGSGPTEKQSIFIKFNVDGLLRGDYQSRMNGYAVARQNGWLSANDIRELEDMNRIPAEEGGDLYLVNGNMLPLSQAGNFYGKEDSSQ